MAERDLSQREPLFSDVPGDGEKVRKVLAQWGVEESSIRRLMRELRADPALGREAHERMREPQPPKHYHD